MKIPEGMTQEEVVAIIQKIAKRLAPKFTFGHFDVYDIEQEAFLIGMDGLERHDSNRPLENFLSVHMRNRLYTFKRDNFARFSYECSHCNNSGEQCDYCEKRQLRIDAKKNIMEPIGLGDVQDEQESGMRYDFDITLNLEMVEILEIVNQHLDVVLRADYLKMLDGVQVPSHKRRKVEEAIVEILHEHCGQSEGTEEWSLK